jgi:hypothetical protein
VHWLCATAHAARWHELNELVATESLEIQMRSCLAAVVGNLSGTPEGVRMGIRDICVHACAAHDAQAPAATRFHRQRILACMLHGCERDLAVLQPSVPCNLLVEMTFREARSHEHVMRFAAVSRLNAHGEAVPIQWGWLPVCGQSPSTQTCKAARLMCAESQPLQPEPPVDQEQAAIQVVARFGVLRCQAEAVIAFADLAHDWVRKGGWWTFDNSVGWVSDDDDRELRAIQEGVAGFELRDLLAGDMWSPVFEQARVQALGYEAGQQEPSDLLVLCAASSRSFAGDRRVSAACGCRASCHRAPRPMVEKGLPQVRRWSNMSCYTRACGRVCPPSCKCTSQPRSAQMRSRHMWSRAYLAVACVPASASKCFVHPAHMCAAGEPFWSLPSSGPLRASRQNIATPISLYIKCTSLQHGECANGTSLTY